MAAYFESGLTVGNVSWHGQEMNIPANDERRFNIGDCMSLSGMDNLIFETPVYLPGVNDPIDGYKAINERFSDGRIVTHGIMQGRYQILQNSELFQWFQPWLDSREVSIETCGRLHGGAVVWVMARLQREAMEITSGDRVEKFLTLLSSHNGQLATQVGFNGERIVCHNTMSIALGEMKESGKLRKIKHTVTQNAKLSEIRDTVNLIDRQFETQASYWRMMANTTMDIQSVGEYIAKVFKLPENANDWSTRTRNQFDRVMSLAVKGLGQEGKPTVWNAYNGITQYLTHDYGRSAENRLAANWYGAAKDINDRANLLAMQLAS